MASLCCEISPFLLNGCKKYRNSRKPVIQCSLRDKGLSKKPMWKKAQDMSTETMNASKALKLASSALENPNKKITEVFETKISRLIKSDLLSLLFHLQKSDRCELAIKVFECIRKEIWYTPDINLYRDMIYMLGRNKLVEKAEYYFQELKKEGLRPDSKTFTEMIGTFSKAGFINQAMETYNDMKKSGCEPTELTFIILIRNLQRFGEKEMIEIVKKDVNKYVEEPEEFFRKEQIV